MQYDTSRGGQVVDVENRCTCNIWIKLRFHRKATLPPRLAPPVAGFCIPLHCWRGFGACRRSTCGSACGHIDGRECQVLAGSTGSCRMPKPAFPARKRRILTRSMLGGLSAHAMQGCERLADLAEPTAEGRFDRFIHAADLGRLVARPGRGRGRWW